MNSPNSGYSRNPHRPYSDYKTSGVEYLGDIPKHWKVRRLKYTARIIAGQSPPSANVSEYSGHSPFLQGNAEFGSISPSPRLSCEVPAKIAQAGDVLLSVRAPVGAINVAEQAYGIGRGLCAIRPNTSLAREFAYYALRVGRVGLDMVSTGSTYEAVSVGDVGGLPFPLPPLSEQSAIVRYLDHSDSRIQRYISAKVRLIELLTEQKQAIISQAVTCGLDPLVRLKPSGVKWLGDVPEHWDVVRNGRLFAQRNETGFPDLPILEVSLRTGVAVRDFGNSERKQMLKVRSNYKRAVVGDLTYNMMRMWQGAVGVAPVDGLVSPAYVIARPLPGVESLYFSALFRTPAYMAEVDKHSRGIVKDRNRLYWEDFKQMEAPCPPYEEQVAIVGHLGRVTTEIDSAISRARNQIELMQEYRTRLIADVVTGKLDVRKVVCQLDEIPS